MSEQPRVNPACASYSERLRAPWWWYLAGMAAAFLLGAEFAAVIYGWAAWVPLLILLPASIAMVLRLSSGRLAVTESRLVVTGAQLSLEQIDQAIALTSSELRRLVGRQGDPAAFTFVRGWIGPGLQLVLKESRPIPYWVVSSRHPDRVLNALKAGSIPIPDE
jgi:hypothetical protein